MKGPDRTEQGTPMKPGKDEKIILASGSPRRRAMMEFFGVPFEVIPSELSEFFAEGEGQWRALDMARKKAFMLSRKQPGRYILAADTMVQVGKHYLGKPKDRDDAVRMLKMLSGRAHQVYTGMAAADTADGDVFDICSVSTVYFRTLTEQQIKRYVASGEPMDKAGAYGIQGQGAMLVERMDGDFFGVMGLSVYCLHKLLWERFGLDIFCCAQGSQGSQQRFE